ncbi:hypothetical protein ACFLRF_01980 [Candidatus Altiarchaeota archaeon]
MKHYYVKKAGQSKKHRECFDALASRNNTILIRYPKSPQARRFITREDERIIEDMTKGRIFFDYMNLTDELSHFSPSNHLNDRGAILLSQSLAEDLRDAGYG